MTVVVILNITGLLLIWNLFVINYLAKWVYNIIRNYKDIPTAYISRKFVHIFGEGITVLLIPIFYEGYYGLVTLSAFGLAAYLLMRARMTNIQPEYGAVILLFS